MIGQERNVNFCETAGGGKYSKASSASDLMEVLMADHVGMAGVALGGMALRAMSQHTGALPVRRST